MADNPREIHCACCGRPGTHAGHGWIKSCYARWRHHGKPEGGPPPANPRKRGNAAGLDGRIEDYAELRSWGLNRYQAAERLGVTPRTTWRYDTLLRQQKGAA